MIINPDPSKYKIRKLRKRGYVLVDKQILLWRKTKKQDMEQVEKAGSRRLRKAKEAREEESNSKDPAKLWDAFKVED